MSDSSNSNHQPDQSESTSYLDLDCDAIPIFSEQFLELNRQREAELRQLRKATSDLEEQNANLSKHIETMNCAIEQLESEFIQHRTAQALARQKLTRIRQLLFNAFAENTIPGTNLQPTLSDIDPWMVKLKEKIKEMAPNDPQVLEIKTKVNNVMAKVDM